MSNQYRLVELGNSQLVAGLSELVQQSNELVGQVLAHLVELEERKLHLELGFSSLFAYCVEMLGMSEGSAGRRVTAARVCRRFPEVFERVARGQLHLCALCALAPHLNEENAVELFEACQRKTRRKVEELLAARFPRPDVREQIRRLPPRAEVPAGAVVRLAPSSPVVDAPRDARRHDATDPPSVVPETTVEPLPALIPGNSKDSRPPQAEARTSDARHRPHGRELEPLSADRFGVHFTADAELRDLIERARGLASHRIPNGELAGLMKLVLASFVKQEEKRRFGVGTKVRRANAKMKHSSVKEPATPPGEVSASPGASEDLNRTARSKPRRKRGRYLALKVRRDIHARDGGQCAFVSPDGRRCNARTLLEFDHVKPFARFGAGDTPNLRLLCKAHNLLHARHCFGAVHIAAKIAARNRSASEPRRSDSGLEMEER
jgi:hypothetical protein